MIGDILYVTLPGFALGMAIMAVANRRAEPEVSRARWLKLVVFFLIVHIVLGVAAAGRPWVIGLLLGVLLAGGIELWRAWRRIEAARPARIWVVFMALAGLVLWAAWRLPTTVFAFLFIVTATCDGFSQVIGQWLGRRPLAPRLSPGKTVGGFVGGLLAAVTVAVLVRHLLQTTPLTAAALGLLTGATGLAGDLAASWVKRRARLKDFSSALPGQGGFLDRFDSLLGVLAITGSFLVVCG